jgi:hypothetical protein
MLGLDPADSEGPQIAIGRFVGERCMRKNAWNISGSYWDTARGNPTNSTKWYNYNYWQETTNGWCDLTQPPPFYSGGTFSVPTWTVGSDAPPTPLAASPNPCAGGDQGWWSPYYPAACTLYQLGANTSAAHTAVNNLRTGARLSGCDSTPGPGSPSSSSRRNPYRGGTSASSSDCDAAGTSHTAGLATAARELNSSRTRYAQGQLTFRRVVILETDGVVCNISVPFNTIQARQRALALAQQMKNMPDAFQGIEIFTIMFWNNDGGSQTCPNGDVDDNLGSLYPNCPNATSLTAAGPRSIYDDYLIQISSSRPNTCDHYFPFNKTNGSQLHTVYREILKRLAVGKLMG